MKAILKTNFEWSEISDPDEKVKFNNDTKYEVVHEFESDWYLGGKGVVIINKYGESMSVSSDSRYVTLIDEHVVEGKNDIKTKSTPQFPNTAKHTFDNFKLVFYSLLRNNPLITRKQLAEKIGFVLDSGVSQICHLMNWDYDIHFDTVYNFIVYKNATFDDLKSEIEDIQELIEKLRYEGVGK